MTEKTFRVHSKQADVLNELFVSKMCRYSVVAASRGFGKSYLGAAAIATAASELTLLPSGVPNKVVHIIAPTHEQAVDIYYPILAYDLGLESVFRPGTSESTGKILLPNNTRIQLLSYEAVERMRGKGSYFVLWDEVSSCKKGMKPSAAWEQVIKPCITTRWSRKAALRVGAQSPGRALFISTPKGFNFFNTLWSNASHVKDWKAHRYDYTTSPYLDPAEVESMRDTMSAVDFASEYLADFKESGSSVFYCFDRDIHVTDLQPLQDGETVYFGIDFNVGLQCTSVFVDRGGQMQVLDEMKGHPDTTELARRIAEKYKGHRLVAYPDPSGKARKTSAPVGQTDFTILKQYGIEVLAKSVAPSIVDSVAAVNGKLKSASGLVGLLVDRKCRGVADSLERTRWVERNPDMACIDKSEGHEHFSDGIRYAVDWRYPIRKPASVVRGFSF